MHFTTATIFSASLLSTLAVAAPLSSENTVLSRQYRDCEAGLQWYTCAKNGFAGCCQVDPCNLEGCPSTEEPESGIKTIMEPELYTIHKQNPEASGPKTKNITLAIDEENETHQVIIFRGIPAGAKNCGLGWDQGPIEGRNFIVEPASNGLTSIFKLSAVPMEPVTYTKVQGLITDDKVGSADFGNWASAPATGHGVGTIDCAETIALEVSLAKSNGDEAYIFLAQDFKNGWSLTYEI